MKPWHLALVGLAVLAIAGCRSDPAVPILERELRLKEDEIYRLRGALEDYQDCSQNVPQRADDRSRPAATAEPQSDTRRSHGSGATNGFSPPQVELPSRPATSVPDSLKSPSSGLPPGLEVPDDVQRPSKPTTDRGRSASPGDVDGPALGSGSTDVSSRPRRMLMASQSASAVPFTPAGDSRQVAAIALNRTLTGGISADGRTGDQGLLVVVEPRDRAGRAVDAPAEMSVVVIDEALDGAAARVARWDFNAAETAAMFRCSGSTQAIHLTAAWPADPPVHSRLHLFVRYVTADGRRLQTDMPIEVALAGDKTARWSPSDQMIEDNSASEMPPSSESPTARSPDSPPLPAGRSPDAQSHRPAWSPERR